MIKWLNLNLTANEVLMIDVDVIWNENDEQELHSHVSKNMMMHV